MLSTLQKLQQDNVRLKQVNAIGDAIVGGTCIAIGILILLGYI